MKRETRWAPLLAQSIVWSTVTLIAAAAAMAQAEPPSPTKNDSRKKEPPPTKADKAPAKAAEDRAPDAGAPARSAAPAKSAEAPAGSRRDAANDQDRAAEGVRGRRADEPAAERRDETPRRRDEAARRDERPEEGTPRRPAGLGMKIEGQGEQGLSVTDVERESLAARAGLRTSDRIISADGHRFTSPRQFMAYLGGQAGRRVPIIIEREGRQYTVQLTPSMQGEGAWLGVYMEDEDANAPGARVTQVYPTSPAARAGFRPGDVIVKVNGQAVESSPDVIALVEEQQPGSRAEFLVRRNNQDINLMATLGRRDAYVFTGRGQRSFEDQESESYDQDPYSGVPPYVMQLEHDRRVAEQHQRIEEALRDLQEEVKKLRAELTKGRQGE